MSIDLLRIALISRLVGLALCFGFIGPVPAIGQAISPPVSKSFPFQVGIIMDGGTLYVLKRATRGEGEMHYCFDGGIESPTKGEFFEGALHPSEPSAKKLAPREAEKRFATIVESLGRYFGKAKLKEIREHPVDPEKIDEKDAERLVKKSSFNDRFAAQLLLQAIDNYRQQHPAEAATPPDAPRTAPPAGPSPSAPLVAAPVQGELRRALYLNLAVATINRFALDTKAQRINLIFSDFGPDGVERSDPEFMHEWIERCAKAKVRLRPFSKAVLSPTEIRDRDTKERGLAFMFSDFKPEDGGNRYIISGYWYDRQGGTLNKVEYRLIKKPTGWQADPPTDGKRKGK